MPGKFAQGARLQVEDHARDRFRDRETGGNPPLATALVLGLVDGNFSSAMIPARLASATEPRNPRRESSDMVSRCWKAIIHSRTEGCVRSRVNVQMSTIACFY